MERNAAHSRPLTVTAITAGKGKLKLTGSNHCILKEALVKVAKAVHENMILILGLNVKILLHHGGNHGKLASIF